MPAAVQYFYAVNGAQQGPVSLEQLKALFANRTINRESLRSEEHTSELQSLTNLVCRLLLEKKKKKKKKTQKKKKTNKLKEKIKKKKKSRHGRQ